MTRAELQRLARRLHRRVPVACEIEDLVQAGEVGLLKARLDWDPAQGASFRTYSYIRVRGAMLDAIREYAGDQRDLYRAGRRLREVRAMLEQRLLRPPTALELADAAGMSLAECDRLLACLLVAASPWELDEEIPAHGRGPADEAERLECLELIASAVTRFPVRWREVVLARYRDGMGLAETSAAFGVTVEHISRVHTQAMERLRRVIAPERWVR